MNEKSPHYFAGWLRDVNDQHEKYVSERKGVYDSFFRWAFDNTDLIGLPDYVLEMIQCHIEDAHRESDFGGMHRELKHLSEIVKEAYEAGYKDAKAEIAEKAGG